MRLSSQRLSAWRMLCFVACLPVPAASQTTGAPAPDTSVAADPFEHSAEFGWLGKKVLASRVLDDMTDSCKLDTLSMVLVFEHWRRAISAGRCAGLLSHDETPSCTSQELNTVANVITVVT